MLRNIGRQKYIAWEPFEWVFWFINLHFFVLFNASVSTNDFCHFWIQSSLKEILIPLWESLFLFLVVFSIWATTLLCIYEPLYQNLDWERIQINYNGFASKSAICSQSCSSWLLLLLLCWFVCISNNSDISWHTCNSDISAIFFSSNEVLLTQMKLTPTIIHEY